jgi:hypothetical protein
MDTDTLAANPYVGPRTFTRAEADRFFGREYEARELLALIAAERLVLFYAQSGAGKSSLINARLIPQLHASGYAVLPIGRVQGELPPGVKAVDNIFVFNLMLSLDQSKQDPQRFAQMKLSDFFAKLTSADGEHYEYDANADASDEAYEAAPHILIIDQFEEIITTNPDRWRDREGFFRQLNQAMLDDPWLWVVLTLREDYIAAIEPYAYLLADKMRARFYMQRMEVKAALEAIKEPARQAGRPFVEGVAEKLVDNLRQIHVPGQAETQPGQYVEPVQLQVVCYQLWENLKNQPGDKITEQDLTHAGNVDTALANFYEQALKKVVSDPVLNPPRTLINKVLGLNADKDKQFEADLRDWFDHELITEAGTRGVIYRGDEKTGSLPTRAVDLLANQYLLRADARAGGTWVELTHDRFIQPILKANQEWKLTFERGVSRAFLVTLVLVLFLSLACLCNFFQADNMDSTLLQVEETTKEEAVTQIVQDWRNNVYVPVRDRIAFSLVFSIFFGAVLIGARNQLLVYGRLIQRKRLRQLFAQIRSDVVKNVIAVVIMVVILILLLAIFYAVLGPAETTLIP